MRRVAPRFLRWTPAFAGVTITRIFWPRFCLLFPTMLSFLPSLPGAKPKGRAVAAKNASLKVKIDHKDARLALAARLVSLFPGLLHEKYAGLYAFAVQVLGNVALEEVLKTRKALFSTLKDYACLPPKIAEQLAREAERAVSEPILRFCAGLSDQDLKAILHEHPQIRTARFLNGARLRHEPVLVSGDHDVVLMTQENVSTSWLREIVEQSRHAMELQRPTMAHTKLPYSVEQKLNAFVDKAIEDLLMEHEELDYRTSSDITTVFRRRMNYITIRQEEDSVVDFLKKALKDGRFDEELIADALAVQDYAFVWAALAYKAKTTMQHVQTIFGMKAAKPIVALCWQAGISMRFAFQLQKDAGFVPAKDLIYPREGSDYPLSLDNIKWQLEFLGLKVA